MTNTVPAVAMLLSTSMLTTQTWAAPEGGVINAGAGSIDTVLSNTTINQLTSHMVVDWDSFNIASGESVQFIQPSSTAAALNHIHDLNATQIFGNLTANGNIFLINNNGFLFGDSASVQVGGLITSNLMMNAGEFMSGMYQLYSAGGEGMVVNRGLIAAATGGVSLISDNGVVNEGRIVATLGNINLAAARSATIDFDGDGLLQIQVGEEVIENARSLDDAINNSGELIAEGGTVLIDGHVSRDVFTNAVNNSGVIRATGVVNEGGVVRLVSSGGDITHSGNIDVSSADAQGGNAHLLGDRVALTGDAHIDASGATGGGEVLIGGDYQGANADIANARQSYVGEEAVILANATEEGDGGKVIVWGDSTTQYYGHTEAKGGALAGDGGFVEVSGKSWLDFDGTVDTLANNGVTGTLLLDPTDVFIADDLGNAQAHAGAGGMMSSSDTSVESGGVPYVPDGTTDDSLFLTGTLTTLLTSTDVDISATATGTGSGTGKIVVVDDISLTVDLGATRTLTLNGKDIFIDATIDASGQVNALNVILNADTINGGGTVELNATIDTNNGDLTVSSVGDIRVAAAQSVGTGTADFTTTDSGSDIYSNAAADIITASTITLDSGGSIGVTGALHTDFDETGTNLNLASGAEGNIIIVEHSAMDISDFTITDMGGADPDNQESDDFVRSIDITADGWTIGATDLDVGDDQLAIRTSTSGGGMTGGTGRLSGSRVTLSNLRNDDADDVGASGAGNDVLVGTADLIIETSGDFYVSNNVTMTALGITVDPNTKNGNIYSLTPNTGQSMTMTDQNNSGIFITFDSSTDIDFSLRNTAATDNDGIISVREGDIDANIDAGPAAGSVALTSDTGSIFSETATSVITASQLSITSERDVDVNVASTLTDLTVSLNPSDDNETYSISLATAGQDIVLEDNGSSGLNVEAESGSAMNLTVRNRSGNVNAGALIVGGINDIAGIDLAGSSALTLISDSGSVQLTNPSVNAIVADSLLISAAADITSADTSVATLAAQSTGSGAIDIDNSGKVLTIGSLSHELISSNPILGIDQTSGSISISNDDHIIISSPVDTESNNSISITTTGSGNIDGAGGVNTINTVALDAGGGIGISTPVVMTAGERTITTNGNAAAGNVSIVETQDVTVDATADLDFTFNGSGTQKVDLEASSWTFDADLGGTSGEDLVLRATGGSITDGTVGDGGNTITAATAVIDATAAIDVSLNAEFIEVNSGAALHVTNNYVGTLNVGGIAGSSIDGLTSGGLPGDDITLLSVDEGSINLIESVNAGGGNILISTTDTATNGTYTISGNGDISGQNISLTADASVDADTVLGAGALTVTTNSDTADGNITIADSGDLNTTQLILNIGGSGTQTVDLTANSWTVGADFNEASGENLLLTASGGSITDGTPDDGGNTIAAATAILDATAEVDVSLDAASIEANSGAKLHVTNNHVGTLTVGATGLTSGGLLMHDITLLSVDEGSIVLNGAVDAGLADVVISTTDTATNGTYTISGNGDISGQNISLTADASVDADTVLGAGALTVTTNSDAADGNITIADSGDLNTTQVILNIGGSGTQTVDLTANSWTVGADFNEASGENLLLTASGGSITDGTPDDGGNTIAAATAILDATAEVDVSLDAASIEANSGAKLHVTNNHVGTLTVGASGLTSGGLLTHDITLLSVDEGSIVLNGVVNAGQADVVISTTDTATNGTYTISGNGDISGQNISLTADASVDADTVLGAGALTVTTNSDAADGNITIADSGDLNTTQVILNIGGSGTQTVDLTANSWTVGADFNEASGENLLLTASGGSITDGTPDDGGNTIAAATAILDATAEVDVSLDAASIEANSGAKLHVTNNHVGTLTVGASGLTSGGLLTHDITLLSVDEGSIVLNGVVDAGLADVVISTTDTVALPDGLYTITGAGVISGDSISLTADDAINVVTTLGGGTLSFTNAAGADITLDDSGDLATSDLTIANTGSARTLNLTADSWVIDGLFNVGSNHLNLTAQETNTSNTHGIFNAGGSDSIVTTGNIDLDSATGIGTSLSPVMVSASGLSLTTTGANSDGDIYVDGGTAALSLAAVSTAATAQNVSLSAGDWTLSGNVDFGTDSLALTAVAGNVDDAGAFSITADSIGMSATGFINMTTVAGTIAASADGAVNIDSTYSAGDLVVGTVDTISGLSSTNDTVTLTSQDATIDITQAITASDVTFGAVSLTTTDTAIDTTLANYDITGGALITTANALVIDSDGGIGTTGAVNTDAGSLSLSTRGNNANGNVSVILAGAQTTSAIPFPTIFGTGIQTIDLQADSWVNDSSLIIGTDNLVLRASAGDITRSGGNIVANDLSLFATAVDASIGNNGVTIDPLSVNLTGTLTADTANGTGGIYITETGSMLLGTGGIDAGSGGNVQLISSGTITGSGTVTGNDLLMIADSTIAVSTQVSNLAILQTDIGSIDIVNTGALNIGTVLLNGMTAQNGIVGYDGAITIEADDTITISQNIVESNNFGALPLPDDITLRTTANDGNIAGNGGTITTGAVVILDADGGIGGASPVSINAASTSLATAGVGALGNVYLAFSGTQSTSAINSLLTSGTGKQIVDLIADGWTVDADIGNSADDLIMTAITGAIDRNGNVATIIADNLALRAPNDYIADSSAPPHEMLLDVNTLALQAGSVIYVSNNGALTIGDVTDTQGVVTSGITTDAELGVRSVGDLQVDSPVNATGGLALVAEGVGSDIESNGSLITGGDSNLTPQVFGYQGVILSAGGGIGLVSPLNITGFQQLDITTAATGTDGNINIDFAGSLSTSGVSLSTNTTVAPAADGLQTVMITADDWTIENQFDLGGDNFTMVSDVGGITNSINPGVHELINGNDVVLNSNLGIGAAGAGNELQVTASSLDLTTAGVDGAGSIYVRSGGALDLSSGITTHSSQQDIVLVANAWHLTADQSIADDALVLTATAGDISTDGNRTITATSVGLVASGSISGVSTVAATVAASSSTGSISITSDYDVADVEIGALATVAGLSTGTGGDITFISNDAGIIVTEAVDAGTGSVTLQTLEPDVSGDYDIGGTGLITAGTTLTVDADGSITGLNVDLQGTGALDLTTASAVGSANGGDITVDIVDVASTMSTSRITAICTDGGTACGGGVGTTQNISLTAEAWLVDNALDVDNDNLMLIADAGSITSSTTNAISARNLVLDASAVNGATIGDAFSATGPIVTNLTGTITADASNGIGGIYITDGIADMDISSGGIDAGTGNVELVTANDIVSSGTITADSLLVVANDVTSDTDIHNLSATTTGNLNLTNVNLINTIGFNIADQSQSDGTVHNGIDAAGSITLTDTVGAVTQSAASSVTGMVLTTISSGGVTLDSAGNDVGVVDITESAGGNVIIRDIGDLEVAGISTTGDVSITTTGAVTNTGAVSANGLTTSTVGGMDLDHPDNEIASFTATDSGAGDIFLTDKDVSGNGLSVGQVSTDGNITITSAGDITQALDIITAAGDITVASSAGILTMAAGAESRATGGAISYTSDGDLTLGVLQAGGDIDAVSNTGDITQTADITSSSGDVTVDATAGSLTMSTGTASRATNGNIAYSSAGDMTLQLFEASGVIDITSSTGDISQQSDIISSAGNISVAATAGSLTMSNGASTRTTGATIDYTTDGDMRLFELDADFGTSADSGTITLNTANNLSTVSQGTASVRAGTVNINALSIGTTTADSFLLHSDIQGQVTLNYLGNAFIAVHPNPGVVLNISDLGSGLVDSSAARSAGNQRGQSSGLEDVGFIDAALFSDINLFVVDGTGIALPEDQSDISPEDRRRFEQLEQEREQGAEASSQNRRSDLDVSAVMH